MKTIVSVLFALSATLICGPGTGAQINKCLDASGKVVGYGAECPSGTRAEETKIKGTPPASGAGAAPAAGSSAGSKSTAEREAEFRKRQVEQQEAKAKAAKKAEEAEHYKQACESARTYMKQLQDKQRITRTDPKTGERSFLNDSDYPGEVAKTQKRISENCK